MAKETAESAGTEGKRHMTLTEVAERAGLSMPTLQKYKKLYSSRIPSVGKGRTQRYPEEAVAVIAQLRDENMARRGRPRKNAAAAKGTATRRRGRAARRGRPRKGAGEGGEGMLTLTQVAQRTKISYPTLLRYVKTSLGKIPHVGSGRRRRFKPDAVAVFQRLRAESRPGRRPAAKAGRRGRPAAKAARRGRPPGSGGKAGGAEVLRLTSVIARLERRLSKVESELKKPLRIVRR